jgi:hypothetical protein
VSEYAAATKTHHNAFCRSPPGTPRGRKTPIKEKAQDSVLGQVGELPADVVYGVEPSRRQREMDKGKCPAQKPLRRTFSKGRGGEVENKPCPD